MKAIALLLSFLVLGSIGTPCDDTAEIQSQIELNQEHEEDSHEEENCSPFCACQCCHSNTYQPQLIELYSISEPMALHTIQTSIKNQDWVFKEIQPPRQFLI